MADELQLDIGQFQDHQQGGITWLCLWAWVPQHRAFKKQNENLGEKKGAELFEAT